jgi:hypothetical protein
VKITLVLLLGAAAILGPTPAAAVLAVRISALSPIPMEKAAGGAAFVASPRAAGCRQPRVICWLLATTAAASTRATRTTVSGWNALELIAETRPARHAHR